MKRDDRIARANELIRDNPDVGRRVIARKLREEYGTGLRDAVILKLQREIYPQPRFYPEMRERRLVKEGFLPFEAEQYKKLAFNKTEFMNKPRRERQRDYKNFIDEQKGMGLSTRQAKREWKDYIADKYAGDGFTLEDGSPDFWQLFRENRAEAIKGGDWKETPRYRGKSHRRLRADGKHQKLDKGRLKAQRARHKEKIAKQKLSKRRN